MAEASPQLKAALIIANSLDLKGILSPIIDVENETIHFERLAYGVLSGGQKAAIIWLYCIWADELPPAEWGWRDPFEGFSIIDPPLQNLVLKAMALRHECADVGTSTQPSYHATMQQQRITDE